MDLVFRDIEVTIKNKNILKQISGIAEKGDMLAIMGPSGKYISFYEMRVSLITYMITFEIF